MTYVAEINIGNFSEFFENNFVVNGNYFLSVLNSNNTSPLYITCGSNNPTTGFERNTYTTFGYRLLEIAAVNIFLHAQSRAAIANDTDIVNSYYNSIIQQTSDAFNNENQLNSNYSRYYMNLTLNIQTVGTEANYMGPIGGRANFVQTNIFMIITNQATL
jgi:hypothetical protein